MTRHVPISDDGWRFLRKLGSVLGAIRGEQGMQQATMALRTEMGSRAVSNIESPRADPGFSRVLRMARALGLPLSVVMRRVEMELLDAPALEEKRQRIASALRRLPPADLDLLAVFVGRLLAQAKRRG